MQDVDRRELVFENLDQAVADAEQLAGGETRTTGNHTYGQILEHLARSLDAATGRVEPPTPPFFMRLLMPIVRSMVLNGKPLKPGVKLPANSESFFWPNQEFDVHEALIHFKEAVENYKSNGPIPKHPFFGNLTRAQNDDLNCRHCSSHLSFVHPVT